MDNPSCAGEKGPVIGHPKEGVSNSILAQQNPVLPAHTSSKPASLQLFASPIAVQQLRKRIFLDRRHCSSRILSPHLQHPSFLLNKQQRLVAAQLLQPDREVSFRFPNYTYRHVAGQHVDRIIPPTHHASSTPLLSGLHTVFRLFLSAYSALSPCVWTSTTVIRSCRLRSYSRRSLRHGRRG